MDSVGLRPPPVLSLDGNVGNNWKKWRQQFELYFVAIDGSKKDKNVQIAIFLNLIGPEALEIYNTFELTEDEKKDLAALKKRFEAYCIPKKNITYERHLFNIRNMNEGENIDQYVMELKKLAASCEYGDLKDSLIADRIVCGIRNDDVRARLLREENLNLDGAIHICRAAETTYSQVKQMKEKEAEINQVQSSSKKIFRKNSAFNASIRNAERSSGQEKKNGDCSWCGYSHAYGKCPAYGQSCKKCGRRNHFAKMCKSSSTISGRRPRQVNEVVEESEETEEMKLQTLFLGAIENKCSRSEGREKWMINVQINGKIVRFALDTGAEANVLPEQIWKQLDGNYGNLQPSNVRLVKYGGEVIDIKGKAELNCLIKGRKENVEFLIVAEKKGTPIIGQGTCFKLDLVRRVLNLKADEDKKQDNAYSYIYRKYDDVFKGIGTTEYRYNISLKDDAIPVVHAPRRVPVQLMPRLKDELERMEKLGVITRVEEPTDWVNSITIVEKPNKQLRICLDPRDLNKAIRREHYHLPTMEEICSRVGKSKIWSKLDANSGFWQISLTDSSSDYTTFNTPFGRWKFLKLPFGIKSAPEVFQRVMAEIVEGIEGVEVFIDDILIFADSKRVHDLRLEAVLERMRKANVKLNREKCIFGQNSIKYLGFVFSAGGLKVDDNKVTAIKKMPRPENKEELRRFLGMVTYVARFLPDMSQTTACLRDLVHADSEWNWKSEHEIAFEKLKKQVTEAPILMFYDTEKAVQIHTDSSGEGMGAVLMQDNKPVAYASKALTETQKRYAPIERELLAVVFGCERFHQYIYGKEIEVISDHKPLESITKKPLHMCPPRLQRLLMRLQRYPINVSYRPGRLMQVPDTLSRSFDKSDVYEDEEDYRIHQIMLELDEELSVHELLFESSLPATEEKLNLFRNYVKTDPTMKSLVHHVKNGWPNSSNSLPTTIKQFFQCRDEISLCRGMLLKGDRLIVPEPMQGEMLQLIHQGHWGMEKCKQRAREVIYWPNMNKDIENLVQRCDSCLQYQRNNQKEPMKATEVPSLPWEVLGTDLFEYKGRNYLVLVDYYSGYPEIALLEDSSSNTVIRHMKSMLARHGIPDILRSDGGPCYTSKEFKEFTKAWNIKHVTSSPYYPKSNGLAERTVQSIKNMLKKTSEAGEDPYLGLLNYRATPKIAEQSPGQLLMNRRLKTLLPMIPKLRKPHVGNKTFVRQRFNDIKNRQEYYYNQHSKEMKAFNVGDSVMLKDGDRWIKAKVVQVTGEPRSYVVETLSGRRYRRNRFYLRPDYQCRDQHQQNGCQYDDIQTEPAVVNLPVQNDPRHNENDRIDNSQLVTRSGRLVRPPDRLSSV